MECLVLLSMAALAFMLLGSMIPACVSAWRMTAELAKSSAPCLSGSNTVVQVCECCRLHFKGLDSVHNMPFSMLLLMQANKGVQL